MLPNVMLEGDFHFAAKDTAICTNTPLMHHLIKLRCSYDINLVFENLVELQFVPV